MEKRYSILPSRTESEILERNGGELREKEEHRGVAAKNRWSWVGGRVIGLASTHLGKRSTWKWVGAAQSRYVSAVVESGWNGCPTRC